MSFFSLVLFLATCMVGLGLICFVVFILKCVQGKKISIHMCLIWAGCPASLGQQLCWRANDLLFLVPVRQLNAVCRCGRPLACLPTCAPLTCHHYGLLVLWLPRRMLWRRFAGGCFAAMYSLFWRMLCRPNYFYSGGCFAVVVALVGRLWRMLCRHSATPFGGCLATLMLLHGLSQWPVVVLFM